MRKLARRSIRTWLGGSTAVPVERPPNYIKMENTRRTAIPAPQKMNWVNRIRTSVDAPLSRLPWPNINPTLVTFLSVVLSVGFLLCYLYAYYGWATLFLIVSLLLDWIDGTIARKYGRSSRRGWVIDTVADRLSEALILFPFLNPWYALWLVNCALSIYSYRRNRSVILPIRLGFLIYGIYFMITR